MSLGIQCKHTVGISYCTVRTQHVQNNGIPYTDLYSYLLLTGVLRVRPKILFWMTKNRQKRPFVKILLRLRMRFYEGNKKQFNASHPIKTSNVQKCIKMQLYTQIIFLHWLSEFL